MCEFRLRQPPQNLAELGERMKLLETLQVDLAKTEAQIPLIHDQFAILDKYEVQVEQAVSTSLLYDLTYSVHMSRVNDTEIDVFLCIHFTV